MTVLWLVLIVLVGSHILGYWSPVGDEAKVDEAVNDAYLEALQAAQRIHSLAWSARQAMFEEARRPLGAE